MIKGIDVSKHNSKIDWFKLKKQGYEFAYIKASQGVGAPDPMHLMHYESAKKAGFSVGFYHFATLNNQDEIKDAKSEAQYFKKIISTVKSDLWPVIDVETNEINLTKSEVEQWIASFYQEMEEKCILYSSAGFLNSYLNTNHRLGSIPLWLSGYPLDRQNPKVAESLGAGLKLPKPPVGWHQWAIWQWTGQGVIEGAKDIVDLNFAKTLYML